MSYRTRVQEKGEDVADARDPANDTMNCQLCNGLTKRGTLSAYGARCFRCFDAFCASRPEPREPSTYASKVREINRNHRKAA